MCGRNATTEVRDTSPHEFPSYAHDKTNGHHVMAVKCLATIPARGRLIYPPPPRPCGREGVITKPIKAHACMPLRRGYEYGLPPGCSRPLQRYRDWSDASPACALSRACLRLAFRLATKRSVASCSGSVMSCQFDSLPSRPSSWRMIGPSSSSVIVSPFTTSDRSAPVVPRYECPRLVRVRRTSVMPRGKLPWVSGRWHAGDRRVPSHGRRRGCGTLWLYMSTQRGAGFTCRDLVWELRQ